MTGVTAEQYQYLTSAIHGSRVRQLRGNSHVEAWDVRRTLIRIFGYGGHDIETKSLDLVREIEHPRRARAASPAGPSSTGPRSG